MNDAKLEIGLKSEIKRQVGLKKFVGNVSDYNYKNLVVAWKMLIGKVPNECLENLVWDHYLNSPQETYIQVNSADIGEVSRIGEYKNEKGKIHMAHFKHNGKYIGTVSNLGINPVSYKTAIPLSKEQFTIHIEMIENPSSLFRLKR